MKNQTKNQTVLLIEDAPQFLEGLTASLAEEGFLVKTASDGEEGLRLLKTLKPDIVVLDLILPKLDGFAVLKAAKDNLETSRIPVIILSNLETAENVERAIRLGASSYLAKPNYDLKKIVAKIKSTIQKEGRE